MIDAARRAVAVPGGAAVALAVLALALRPVGWVAPAVTVAAGLAALAVPIEAEPRSGSRLETFALGVVVLATTTAILPAAPPLPISAVGVGTTIAAAVAEEAVFRRALYDRLRRWGAFVAVAGAAVAFALVHVPAYGWAVVPVDLGAGILFGWQRWATGSWAVPAATHVVANLLAVAW
jgi:membrane protease YdiL (CAAX protease family)